MSEILMFPANKRGSLGHGARKSKRENVKISYSRLELKAHELKDCMSTLILAVPSVDAAVAETPTGQRIKTLQIVVAEMSRLVDEIVDTVDRLDRMPADGN